MNMNVNPRYVVDFLNDLLEIDPSAINMLYNQKVGCNEEMEKHPTVQVGGSGDYYTLGFLGLLNGLFGIDEDGFGPIVAIIEDGPDLKIKKFALTKDWKKEND